MNLRLALLLTSSASSCVPIACVFASERAATVYVARISTVNAWHDLVKDPLDAEFLDAYVAVAALSQELRRYRDGRLSFELEGQLGYNFGDQSHWELNAAFGPRWLSFPWNDVVATSAAFGVGLSLANEVPEVEVALEGDSEQLLIYWVAEFTFGPPGSKWALSLRLHHRSPAFGLLGEDGGMNAVGVGIRRTL
jgi:hypothetical protein